MEVWSTFGDDIIARHRRRQRLQAVSGWIIAALFAIAVLIDVFI
jgi:predicted nucleic acid-binding Zn ribbon protein